MLAVIGGVLLLLSGFFDIVDGSVARVTNKMSRKGAFLDSIFDKLAEVVIFSGIALGQLADSFWCIVGLGMSLLVSYTRARAESLGERLQGTGIGEPQTPPNHCDNRDDTCQGSNAMGNDNCFHRSRYYLSPEGGSKFEKAIFYLSLPAVRLSDSDLTFTMPL